MQLQVDKASEPEDPPPSSSAPLAQKAEESTRLDDTLEVPSPLFSWIFIDFH